MKDDCRAFIQYCFDKKKHYNNYLQSIFLSCIQDVSDKFWENCSKSTSRCHTQLLNFIKKVPRIFFPVNFPWSLTIADSILLKMGRSTLLTLTASLISNGDSKLSLGWTFGWTFGTLQSQRGPTPDWKGEALNLSWRICNNNLKSSKDFFFLYFWLFDFRCRCRCRCRPDYFKMFLPTRDPGIDFYLYWEKTDLEIWVFSHQRSCIRVLKWLLIKSTFNTIAIFINHNLIQVPI